MNIFDTLTSKLGQTSQAPSAQAKRTQAGQQTPKPVDNAPDYAGMKTEDLIKAWQSNKKPEYRDELLHRMRPTMESALNSYAPGMKDKLSVKAAKLTLTALENWKADKGADPKTYVFHNLHRLSRFNADMSNIMKEPESVRYDRSFIQGYIDKFQDMHGREPSLAELADATGLSVKRIDSVMTDNRVVSESATLTEDSGKDTVATSNLSDNDYLEYVYASVGPVDQKIIEWSTGFHKKPVLSTNEIASKLKISASAVSQRKARIQQQMSEIRGLV